jgi:hypothetical protein
MYSAFAAKSEERRTAGDLSEANNSRQGVDRETQHLGVVQAGDDGFAFLVEVDALG